MCRNVLFHYNIEFFFYICNSVSPPFRTHGYTDVTLRMKRFVTSAVEVELFYANAKRTRGRSVGRSVGLWSMLLETHQGEFNTSWPRYVAELANLGFGRHKECLCYMKGGTPIAISVELVWPAMGSSCRRFVSSLGGVIRDIFKLIGGSFFLGHLTSPRFRWRSTSITGPNESVTIFHYFVSWCVAKLFWSFDRAIVLAVAGKKKYPKPKLVGRTIHSLPATTVVVLVPFSWEAKLSLTPQRGSRQRNGTDATRSGWPDQTDDRPVLCLVRADSWLEGHMHACGDPVTIESVEWKFAKLAGTTRPSGSLARRHCIVVCSG